MNMNVLIVDDSILTRKAIRRMIDMVDLQTDRIVEAGNGVEALKVLECQRIDLVLADLNMPVMDGIEMIYHMRGNEKTSHIPVVIVSTESSQTRIEKLLCDNVKYYLHKPFKPENFKTVIENAFGVHCHDD